MSLSRLPFEEAVKRLRISCVPVSVKHKFALFLDTHSDANWECLAEDLGISSLETRWLRETVVNSLHGSPFFRLFDQYLVKSDITLERFVQALEKIKNLACIRALLDEYNNGVFDKALLESNSVQYNSINAAIMQHSGDCPSLHHCQTLPTMSPTEYRRMLLMKTHNYDPVNGNFSSGSTYNSLEGEAGDSISFTQLDSYDSGEFAAEFPVPMNTAICLAETRLPTLGCEEGFKGLYTGNGTHAVSRIQDMPLDLSACYVKAEPWIKEEHGGGCCDRRQNSCDKNPLMHVIHERNTQPRRQDICAGHHRLCPQAALHKPLKCDTKTEGNCGAAVCGRSPVMHERKMENGGRNPRRENPDPDCAGKGSDICCFCLSRSQWSDSIGKETAATICMREPSPGSVAHRPSKRVTDPLSKEELELLEKEKQQTKNPDGTSPVRNTGSSYAVLEQKPFRKDSRSIRVFVTYSDDSKKHMKKVMQLCTCLKNNNFSVSIDVRENHLLSQDKMGWFDKRFKVADYVLVLISPKYYSDVTEPDDGRETLQQNETTLNTLYIHRCMQAEYMMNKCLNKRFIPVLMPGSTKDHVPYWLKNTTIYLWPDQYKNLFFYMMYPAQVISQFMLREQSAKTPTVIKTNH